MVMTKLMPKKMRKLGSPRRLTARRNGIVSPFLPEGGVCGSIRLKTPSTPERMAAMIRGLLVAAAPAGSTMSTALSAAVQPIVPRARRGGEARGGAGGVGEGVGVGGGGG